jgi:hypothetical protein
MDSPVSAVTVTVNSRRCICECKGVAAAGSHLEVLTLEGSLVSLIKPNIPR